LPAVVCLGEIMLQLNTVIRGPLRHVALFEKKKRRLIRLM